VQLCIATSNNDSTQPSDTAKAEEWRDWCVENGFEFVVADLETNNAVEGRTDKDKASEEATTTNDSSSGMMREKGGRERIVEALEANMWPHMQMKPRENVGGRKWRSIREDEKKERERKTEEEQEEEEERTGKEKKDEGEFHHRTERRYGYFSRSIRLPEGIEADKKDAIHAKFENGVLEIRVPAPTQEPAKKIAISKS